MSQVLYAGTKAGVPVLKVMANDVDDPLTTPNNHHGAFRFNNENSKVGYIDQIIEIPVDFAKYPSGSATSPNVYFYPDGTNFSNCTAIITSSKGGPSLNIPQMSWQLLKEFFGKSYQPLVEMRYADIIPGNVLTGPYIDTNTGRVSERGYSISSPAYDAKSNYGQASTTFGGPVRSTGFATRFMRAGQKCIVTCFNLPAHNVPIPDFSTTPAAGQEVIRIDDKMCRIALPGRTVTDTNPDYFILHENKIPAKVLASGEISVTLDGTAVINLPMSVTGSAYMDFLAKRDTDARFWNPPFHSSTNENQSLSFTYTVSGSAITIVNTSRYAITIRYMVCAADSAGFSTGGSRVMLSGNDGSQDYIQIKRPGSSDSSPTLSDIMIDTRLTYLPILAEGFLSYPADFPTAISGSDRFKGERMGTVTFDNPDGLLPFAKCGAIFAGEAQSNVYTINPLSVWGNHEICVGGTYDGRASGESTWAEIFDTSVNFYSGGLNRKWLFAGDTWVYRSTMLGLRYYIFGIPNGL